MKSILFRLLISISFIFLTNFSYSAKVYPKKFIDIMKTVLIFEGGFSNILDDPGGATNFGVTQEAYDLYRKNKNLPIKSVKYITKDEVYDCYYRYYYLPSGCDKLPPAVSFVNFDTSVNFGVGGAKKLLQKALNGIEISNLDSLDKFVAIKYIDVRIAKRYEIVSYNEKKRKFLKGWLNRDMNLQELILEYY